MVVTLKIDGRLVLLTAAYLSIGIAALLLAFPGALIWVPSNSSELASWFQAIGSVVAVAVAIAVPYVQHRNDRNVQVAEAVLHSITMSERLAKQSLLLKSLAESSEGLMLRIPYFPELSTAFREYPQVGFPELANQVSLTPVGMEYFREASVAASRVEDFKRAVQECFDADHPGSRDRALDHASCCALNASAACDSARKVLERFLSQNGIAAES